MFLRRCLMAPLLVVSLVLPWPALADDLFRAPPPPWVEMLPLPATPDGAAPPAEDGLARLLSDRQIAWSGAEVFVFSREVARVTAPAGRDRAATITAEFDPAFETVTLTHLDIIRDGRTIPLADAPATVQPRPAEAGGGMTVALQVPGLQVGDVVDHGLLRRSLPRFDGDNRGGVARLDRDEAVAETRLVLNWPADWPTYFSGWPARVSHTAAPGPDGTLRHAWVLRDAPVPVVPEAAPPGWHGGLVLEWSADPAWSGIAAALSDHYLRPYSLGGWQARVEEIRAALPADADRAIAVLRLVQDEITTLPTPFASGNLLARAPAEVIAAGQGDARDKALLLRSILDRLGIPARVALTHRTEGHALNGRKPGLWAFDHAIVAFEVDGMTFWADPTLTHQGGDLWTMVPPDYGHALPLDGPNRQTLEVIPPAYAMQEIRNVTQDFAFSLAGVHLSVITALSGRSADDTRRHLAATPVAEVEAGLRAGWGAAYPGLRQIAPIEISDDRTYNTITLTERYFLPSPDLWAGGLIGDFPFAVPDFTAGLPDAVDPDRAAPLWFGPPASESHTILISGTPVGLQPPAPVQVSNGAWSYSLDAYAGEAGGLSLNWSFTRAQSTLPARDAAQALSDAAAVAGSTFFTWNLRVAD